MPPKSTKNRAQRSYSKTSAQYWQSKVFLEEKPGWTSSNYYVRIQAKGVRRKVRLEATIKEDAGREALARYLKVISQGWPPENADPVGMPVVPAQDQPVTIELWIATTTPLLTARGSTIAKYAESLRTLSAGILGLSRFRKAATRNLVNQMPISLITTESIQCWVDARTATAREKGLTATSRGGNTVRAVLRNARGLFTEHIRIIAGAKLDTVIEDPFVKVRAPKRSITKYTSRFDAETLLAKATNELRTPPRMHEDDVDRISNFEQWKIIYLGLVAGLRYNEIDKLRLRDICCKTGKISIRAHEEFQPKATASEGDVMVSEGAVEVLREMLSHTQGEWLLLEARSSRTKGYRSGLNHDKAVAWLRRYKENGFHPFADVTKPLHELRKEAGTLVNQKHGLNEAKNFLRHGDIATTATFYVGSKGQITTGLC